jgi:hypothetical protein
MQDLGDVFGELFARAGARVTPAHHRGNKEEALEIRRQLPPATAPPAGQHAAEQTATVKQPEQPSTGKDRILKLFSPSGETFELIDNRLKAKNGADYLRRLTYLFLYVQELHGRPASPRKNLVDILKAAKIYDPNTRTWLKKKVGFSVDDDDRFKLNAPGREQAVTALNEALDPNLPDAWNPDTKTPGKRGARKKNP